MRSFAQGTGFELRHVVDNIPWANFQGGTVVDVSVHFFPNGTVFPLLKC
jgi:hypothetical protein